MLATDVQLSNPFGLSNVTIRSVVRAIEDVLECAAECEEIEGRALSICGFSGFKDVVDCLHVVIQDADVLEAEVRVSESSSPDWLKGLDPFLFSEILSTKSISLVLTK